MTNTETVRFRLPGDSVIGFEPSDPWYALMYKFAQVRGTNLAHPARRQEARLIDLVGALCDAGAEGPEDPNMVDEDRAIVAEIRKTIREHQR